MSKVTVNPKLLEWASDRSSHARTELAARFPKLERWIAGEDSPTFNQLDQFAKATSTPLGYLFLKSPPTENLGIPHFRTLADKTVASPSPELLDTIHTMQRRQDWLREYLVAEERDPVRLVNCATQSEDAILVSAKLRNLLGLKAGWAARFSTWTDALSGLRDSMTDAGIVVVVNGVVGNNTHRSLDVEEFRGFVLVDEHAPLVFVNGSDSKSAQMFTLAHELAHLAFGASAVFDLAGLAPASAAIEQACNRVAAEFLVPRDELLRIWNPNDLSPYETVSRRFKVSQIVAARRLLDLGLIDKNQFTIFYRGYISEERRQKDSTSGGNFHATTPQRVGMRFAVELVRALGEGRVLHNEAYRLSGLNASSFNELARRAQEGGPA